MSIQRATNQDGTTRYVVRWREGGRQRGRRFDRLADARAFEAEKRREQQLGAHAPKEPSAETLDEWLKRWFRIDSVRWEKNTRLDRACVVDRWIKPYLADVRLRDLGRARILEWRAAMLSDGASPYRTNKALATLSAALGSAVENERLPANPCVGIKRMPHQKKRPKALSAIQVELIRGELPVWRDRTLVSLMAYAGLRPEEALALRWRDVREHTLSIENTFTARELKPRTKTQRARSVPINQPLREDLDLASGSRLPDSFVVPNRYGHPLDLDNWRSRIWHEAAKDAGVKAVPYDLRHTTASGLIYEGRPLPEIAAVMGHSIEMLLSNYAHLIEDARHAEGWSFEETIQAARAEVGTGVVHESCTRSNPQVPADWPFVEDEQGESEAPSAGFEPATPGLGNLCSIP